MQGIVRTQPNSLVARQGVVEKEEHVEPLAGVWDVPYGKQLRVDLGNGPEKDCGSTGLK